MSGDYSGSEPTTYNVLFVCTGNTCRSPMAEVLARREIARRNWSHVSTASAGIAADPGEPASEQAIVAAGEVGLDLRDHRARHLDEEMVDWADLILTMGESHQRAVSRLGGEEKVALLGDFAEGEEGAGLAVPDPFGGDVELYRVTLSELDDLIRKSFDRLSPILQP